METTHNEANPFKIIQRPVSEPTLGQNLLNPRKLNTFLELPTPTPAESGQLLHFSDTKASVPVMSTVNS